MDLKISFTVWVLLVCVSLSLFLTDKFSVLSFVLLPCNPQAESVWFKSLTTLTEVLTEGASSSSWSSMTINNDRQLCCYWHVWLPSTCLHCPYLAIARFRIGELYFTAMSTADGWYMLADGTATMSSRSPSWQPRWSRAVTMSSCTTVGDTSV